MTDCIQIKNKQDFKGSQEGMQTLRSARLHWNLQTDTGKKRGARSERATPAARAPPAPRMRTAAPNPCALAGEGLPGASDREARAGAGLEWGYSRRYQHGLAHVDVHAGEKHRCACTHGLADGHLSPSSIHRGPRSSDTPTIHPAPTFFFFSKYHSPVQGER